MGNAVGSMLIGAARFDNNCSFQWYNLLAIFGLRPPVSYCISQIMANIF